MISHDQYLKAYLSHDKPHPDAIRAMGLVLLSRATYAGTDRDSLRQLAFNYAAYAADLMKAGGRELINQRYSLGLHHPIGRPRHLQPLQIAGCPARTFSILTGDVGVQVRTIAVYCPSSRPTKADCIARMHLLEHYPGVLWEVLDIKVRREYRRQGLATAMYEAAEEKLRCALPSPSGWLTSEALGFWERRKPGVSEHFRTIEGHGGLHISTRQLGILRSIAIWATTTTAVRTPDTQLH